KCRSERRSAAGSRSRTGPMADVRRPFSASRPNRQRSSTQLAPAACGQATDRSKSRAHRRSGSAVVGIRLLPTGALRRRDRRAGWPRNCRRSACWLLRATLLPGLLSEPNPSWPNSNGALVRRLALKSCVNARLTAAVRVVLCAAHHSSSSRSRVLGNLTFRAIASFAVLHSEHSVSQWPIHVVLLSRALAGQPENYPLRPRTHVQAASGQGAI